MEWLFYYLKLFYIGNIFPIISYPWIYEIAMTRKWIEQHGALYIIRFSDWSAALIHFFSLDQNIGGHFDKCVSEHKFFLLPQALKWLGLALSSCPVPKLEGTPCFAMCLLFGPFTQIRRTSSHLLCPALHLPH